MPFFNALFALPKKVRTLGDAIKRLEDSKSDRNSLEDFKLDRSSLENFEFDCITKTELDSDDVKKSEPNDYMSLRNE
ncbi:MAG: hypothetical protein LBP41_04440 [Holosporaceae bacterium]|jgi:hypothetical protein|nr:hypothetical protein [Holosporaceae bacterium]